MCKEISKSLYMIFPLGLSILSAYMQSLWLSLATVILIFIFVAIVPYCKKRESLWVFVLWGLASIPINYFILNTYEFWIYFTWAREGSRGIVYYLSLLEYMMICSSIEEIVMAIVARTIWKDQLPINFSIEERSRELLLECDEGERE